MRGPRQGRGGLLTDMETKEHVLVVDDDQDFLETTRRILTGKGYEVATVSSASEALARLEAQFYNVAVLDISLPDSDGTELLTRILEMHPDIVAIMLTGHSSVQNAVRSLNRGAFAYLEKPLDPENLISVIGRGLERQRLILENQQLVEELERHNHITNTLLSVSQAVTQSLELAKIIDAALQQVARSTGLEASFVYLSEGGGLKLRGHHGLPPRLREALPAEIGPKGGVMRRIFEQAMPIISEDLDTFQDVDLGFLRHGGYRSFAGVPLAVLGESIGVLGVVTSFARYFSTINIDLLIGVGREIAIAVRNAQLYEEASSARALRELDTMRTEFLANVSHELRTPLAVIKGSANSLLQPDVIFDDETRREFLTSIDKDADTLTRLVDDLLMMSRLEAEGLEVSRERHKLAAVLVAIKDRLDSLTARHHLHIQIPEKLPAVSIDEGRIGEVLTNLVENATKYSEENTNITITAHADDKELVVSVADEGGGIPPELHGKVFERFFQGDARKNGRQGTGLGLAICKGIIEAHGGRIWVESQPGKGATFSFSLPLN